MDPHGSNKTLYTALGANALIAVAKFCGALYTGSSAMMSEGVHSLVDTGNQMLLLYGKKDSSRPADAAHPLGYGMRLYFWSFVVAMMVFALGSLVSLYEGFHKVLDPHPLTNVGVNYAILLIAIGLEGYSLRIAMREVRAQASKKGFTIIETLRRHRDPAIFAVIYEETAALAGLLIALAGLVIAQLLDMPVIDGYTSIGIGVVLAVASAGLARKSFSLITGQAADVELTDRVWDILSGVGPVKEVNEVRSIQTKPNEVNLLVSVDYHDEFKGRPVTSRVIENITSDVGETLREEFKGMVLRIWIEPQSKERHLDELEDLGEEPDALDTEEEIEAAAAAAATASDERV